MGERGGGGGEDGRPEANTNMARMLVQQEKVPINTRYFWSLKRYDG